MSTAQYAPIPVESVVEVTGAAEPTTPSAELLARIRASGRVVAFFCFVQLVVAAFGLFYGNMLAFCVTAMFVSLGLAGIAKSRPGFVAAHFVYSVIVYILTLVGLVYVVLYCDTCGWPIYAIFGLYILIQAIGLKHSRLLIWGLRAAYGPSCGAGRACCPRPTVAETAPAVAPAPVARPVSPAPAPAPTAPVQAQQITYPTLQQMQAMQMQQMQHFANMQQAFQGYPMQTFSGYAQPQYPMMGARTQQAPPAVYRQL